MQLTVIGIVYKEDVQAQFWVVSHQHFGSAQSLEYSHSINMHKTLKNRLEE